MNAITKDPYASRLGGQESLVPREDPVVYAPNATRSAVDAKRVSEFDHNGFMQLDNLFDVREVQYFQREAERLRRDPQLATSSEIIVEPDSREVRSIFDVPKFSELFKRLSHDARLVGWARYLLNDDVYLHQTRLNYKPGFEGRDFYWHSDFETWHVEDGMPRMRAVSISIALTDNRASNGPVMLIPGSHQHYVACAGLTPENHHEQSLRKQEYGVPSQHELEQLAKGHDIAVITGRAGSALLFDCNTMHGSASNITPYPRINLFLVYNAVSNRLGPPFSGQAPRPEYIARRTQIKPVEPIGFHADDYAF